MRRIARFLIERRGAVLGTWALILVVLLSGAWLTGSAYQFDVDIDDSPSMRAYDVLVEHPTERRGDALTIVWHADAGVADPAVAEHVGAVLTQVASMPHVAGVVSPKDSPAQVSADGKTGYALVALDVSSLEVPPADVTAILDVVSAAATADIPMATAGQSVAKMNPPASGLSEGLGVAMAAVILILAFGSVLASALPLAGALIALGASLATVTMVSHLVSIPSFAPQLVSLIGIGVGIDYALFIVARHRTGLLAGKDVHASIVDAYDSSGRAVAFAGVTVIISLGGLVFVRIGFLNGLALAASIGVLFTVLVALTALPAMLSYLGLRVLGRRARAQVGVPVDAETSTRWERWSNFVTAHPWPAIALAAVLLGVLAIPLLDLRLGTADAGSDPPGSTSRQAFDLLATGFVPGLNGQLLIVGEPGHADAMTALLTTAAADPAVAAVGPVGLTVDGAATYASVVPLTAPQEIATTELIDRLRAQAEPGVHVTGFTAAMGDFSSTVQSRLGWFLAGVLILSSLLLATAFRSIAIPVKAALMNLAVAAASFGVLVAVFQWGWGASLIGVDRTGPIESFLPIMLLAVLFGLSMDYQVFLVSRIQEGWTRTHDNTRAVAMGLATTGRVITAAAMIMVCVFLSFMAVEDRFIKMFGVGLAVAVFLDAFLVRSLLVPALMAVLGRWNWWMPAWLDRILPQVTIEPARADTVGPAGLEPTTSSL